MGPRAQVEGGLRGMGYSATVNSGTRRAGRQAGGTDVVAGTYECSLLVPFVVSVIRIGIRVKGERAVLEVRGERGESLQ